MNSSFSHNIARPLMFIAVAALTMAPLYAHAQLKPRGHLCNNLDTVKERTMERVQTRTQRVADWSEQWTERKAERLARLEASRTSADTARTEGYKRLSEIAQTDTQRATIDSFIVSYSKCRLCS